MKLIKIAFLAMLVLWITACGNLEAELPEEKGSSERSVNAPAPPSEDVDETEEDVDLADGDQVDDDEPANDDNSGEGGSDDEADDGSTDEAPTDSDNPEDDNTDGDPGDTPGDGVITPTPPVPPTLITDNVFFPYSDNIAWHYDNSDVVTLGKPRKFAGKTISPLRHSLDIQVFGDEYFYVGDGSIYYGGVNANTDSIPSLETAEARIEFASIRKVYDQYTDSGSDDYLKRGTIATEPEWQRVGLIYNWHSDVVRKELVETVQYGPVPAVAIDIAVAVQIPFNLQIKSGIWFSPGLGVVAREFAGLTTRLEYAEGIVPPVVFNFEQGRGFAEPPRQLLIEDLPVTDHTWQTQVAYLTEGEDWLNVAFDSSGSWRASFQGPELDAGLHVAQIHFTRGAEQQKLVVSVLVQ